MKLIIFDFDGTIADTSEAIVRTFKAAAAANGCVCKSDDEIRLSIGLHLRDMYRELCGVTDPDLIQRCIDSYLVIFRDYFRFITLFPGVHETLSRLKERGLTLAVATNRGADSLVPLMQMLGIDGLIDAYATPESVSNVKPAPDMARLLMSHLGCAPDETLVVGDTVYDVEMGRAAGCHTCAVTYGSHPREQLLTSRPERMIDDFRDLL